MRLFALWTAGWLGLMATIAGAQTPVSRSMVISSPVTGSPVVQPVQSSPAGAVCPKCGRVHGSGVSSGSSMGTSSSSSVMTGRLGGRVRNVLAALNAQRSRQGIRSLRYDAALQAVAQRRAQQMASMGIKSHPPGSFAPGTHEGVGWSSSYSPSGVSACYTSDPRMQYAGAAMATGRDGVYFAVVYR